MSTAQVGGKTVEYEQGGEGRDLVLLPTLLAEMTVYDAVIEDLRKHRRVTRLNFPGFGGSTGPIGERVEDYAEGVVAALSELGLAGEMDLLGNGFGGFVAGTLAVHHGDLFQKLILVDTGPGFPDTAKEPLRILAAKSSGEGMGAVLDAAMQRMFPEPYLSSAPEVINRRREKLSEAEPALFANAALALTHLDNGPRLAEITNPTLVVVGLADETTPPALSHALAAGIPGAELIELPGIGHCPQLQAPAAFLDAICPFLDIP